jgi:hypothetical protein
MMRRKWTWRPLVAVIVFLLPTASRADDTSKRRLSESPPIILWAWERPEDLHFIQPAEVGVAYLAGTLDLRDENVIVHPRLQPLKVPPGTFLVAVVRIESMRSPKPALSSTQCDGVIAEVLRLTQPSQVVAVQIDFDANVSERPFYRRMLEGLRRQLPASIALSITALASWGMDDGWIATLPVDEVVPMLYRMGPDRRTILARLKAGKDFRLPLCRSSIGLSLDDLPSDIPRGRRIYIFNPKAWSAEDLKGMMHRFSQ